LSVQISDISQAIIVTKLVSEWKDYSGVNIQFFGSIAKNGPPTFEQAFKAGLERADKLAK
jgi:hypothetical protein